MSGSFAQPIEQPRVLFKAPFGGIQMSRSPRSQRAFITRTMSSALAACLLTPGVALWTGKGFAASSGPRAVVSPVGQTEVIRIDPLKKTDPSSSNTPNFSGKRDPFKLPVILPSKPGINGNGGGQWPINRPPGIRGLIISQLKLEGIASEKVDHVMIAVVSDNTHRTYFLREHEELYDGIVTRITPQAVYFIERSKDSRGMENFRTVIKELSSRGEGP
jgi:hypothetical protein